MSAYSVTSKVDSGLPRTIGESMIVMNKKTINIESDLFSIKEDSFFILKYDPICEINPFSFVSLETGTGGK